MGSGGGVPNFGKLIVLKLNMDCEWKFSSLEELLVLDGVSMHTVDEPTLVKEQVPETGMLELSLL